MYLGYQYFVFTLDEKIKEGNKISNHRKNLNMGPSQPFVVIAYYLCWLNLVVYIIAVLTPSASSHAASCSWWGLHIISIIKWNSERD